MTLAILLHGDNVGTPGTLIDQVAGSAWSASGGASQTATGALYGAGSIDLSGNTGTKYWQTTTGVAITTLGAARLFTLEFSFKSSASPGFAQSVVSTDQWYCGFNNSGQELAWFGSLSIRLNANAFDGLRHDYAITRDAAFNHYFFQDGVYLGTVSGNLGFGANTYVRLGSDSGGGNPTDGLLDEVRFQLDTQLYGTSNYTVSLPFSNGGTLFTQTLTASSTASASKISGAKAIRSASSTTAAAKVAQIGARRSASSTVTATKKAVVGAIRKASSTAGASVVKQARAIRNAASTTTATIATIKFKLLVLAATVTSSATIQRSVRIIRSAATTTSATAAKMVSATRSAATTTSATLAAIKTKLLTLSASVTTTATRLATVQAIRSAATATAGSVIKGARAIWSSSTTSTASLRNAISATKAASAACTGVLVLLKARFMTLSASVSSISTVAKVVQATRSAAASTLGAVQKRAALIRTGSVGAGATLTTIKARLLVLVASVSVSSSLQRSTQAIRAAAVLAGASAVKRANLARTVATASGAAVQRLTAAKKTASQLTAAAVMMSKAKILLLVATVSSAATVGKLIKVTRTASASTLASIALQSSVVVKTLLGPVWRLGERLALWLADGRSTHALAHERSTLWVVGGQEAMNTICEKRTTEQVVFTIDCTPLLDPGETILSVLGITSDQGGMTFGTPSKNSVPVTTKDGRIIAIGKAVQVEIDGGEIPAGRPWLNCYVRPTISTTLDGAALYNPKREATVILRLIDNPPA